MAVLTSSMSSLRARTGVLAISGGAVLWGTTGIVAHAVHTQSGLAATSIAFYRTLVAALVLAAGRAVARQLRSGTMTHPSREEGTRDGHVAIRRRGAA